MIHVDFIDRANSDRPRCRRCACIATIRRAPRSVRPTRSRKPRTASSSPRSRPRCIACSNCVLACPFGIPKMKSELEQMMKCDMCYDRTSAGKRPMCATVCPSQALAYVPLEEIRRDSPRKARQRFLFRKGKGHDEGLHDGAGRSRCDSVDIVDYMWEPEL